MQDQRTSRAFLIAAAMSMAILAGAGVWAVKVGDRANDVSHALSHEKEALAALRAKLEGARK